MQCAGNVDAKFTQEMPSFKKICLQGDQKQTKIAQQLKTETLHGFDAVEGLCRGATARVVGRRGEREGGSPLCSASLRRTRNAAARAAVAHSPPKRAARAGPRPRRDPGARGGGRTKQLGDAGVLPYATAKGAGRGGVRPSLRRDGPRHHPPSSAGAGAGRA